MGFLFGFFIGLAVGVVIGAGKRGRRVESDNQKEE